MPAIRAYSLVTKREAQAKKFSSSAILLYLPRLSSSSIWLL